MEEEDVHAILILGARLFRGPLYFELSRAITLLGFWFPAMEKPPVSFTSSIINRAKAQSIISDVRWYGPSPNRRSWKRSGVKPSLSAELVS